MNKLLIYALHHPDSLNVYVGKSSSGMERPRAHRSPYNLKKDFPVTRWVKKRIALGQEYEIVVLEYCSSPAELCDAERFYIAAFRAIGMSLLNATDGGEGAAGVKKSPKECAAISARFKGKKLLPEHRAKLSAVHKKRLSNPEARALLATRAANPSPETRAKMRAAHLGVPLAPEHKAKVSAHMKKLHASWRGKKHSPKSLLKMSFVLKNPSPETRAKMSASQRLRAPASAETRAKMSAVRFGIAVHSPESREKIAAHFRGKPRSAETRARMSEGWARNRREKVPRLRINLLSEVRA